MAEPKENFEKKELVYRLARTLCPAKRDESRGGYKWKERGT